MSLKVISQSKEGDKHGCNASTIIHHNDRVLSGADDGKIKVWKPNLELISEITAPGALLSLVATGNTLYTCTSDETIQSWDFNTLQNLGQVKSTLFQPQKLYIQKETQILWAGDNQGNVAKFEKNAECGKFELCEEVWDVMVENDLIYTARDRDIAVSELKVGANNKTHVITKWTLEGRSPFSVAGNRLCFLNREGRNVCIYENAVEKKFPKLNEVVASDLIINTLVAASDNIIYSGGYDNTVKKWDLNSFNCLGSVNVNSCVNALCARSENEIYAATSNGEIFGLSS